MRTTKKCCLFKEYFRIVCFICIQVQNVPPSCSHPFCRHADKMQDKGFQSACLFQRLDLFADMADEIEIEVLQHGSNHHENHVLSHEGKGQMCPAEVIVLYVEVLFARSTFMMSFSVDVRLLVRIQRYVYITPNISVCSLPCLSFKGVRCTTSLYDFPSMRSSMLTDVTSHLS